MPIEVRYAHTNLIAKDWRSLARFYMEVFGCEPAGPERDHTGRWLDEATGLNGAHLRGAHFRLPGHGHKAPTLEIFTYDEMLDHPRPVANRAGYGHIAFEVGDVSAVLESMLEHGGEPLGIIAKTEVPDVGGLEMTYARDPEGNIIELQSWRPAHDATVSCLPQPEPRNIGTVLEDMQGGHALDQNKQLVEHIFHAWEGGDIRPLIEAMDDEFQWIFPGTWSWSGVWGPKDVVIEALLRRALGSQLTGPFRQEADFVLAAEDRVIVQSRGHGRTVSDKAYDNTYCFIFRVRDGKLTEVIEHCDTALVDRLLQTPS